MKRKFPTQSYLLILLFIVFGCSILKNHKKKLFNVKDAYYQSWMVSEQEKGTNIYILITDIENEIVFDSIIFRGVQMPVRIETKEGTTILKSTLHAETTRIENNNTPTSKPNQIIYRHKEVKHSYMLETIRREDMKYNK